MTIKYVLRIGDITLLIELMNFDFINIGFNNTEEKLKHVLKWIQVIYNENKLIVEREQNLGEPIDINILFTLFGTKIEFVHFWIAVFGEIVHFLDLLFTEDFQEVLVFFLL